MTQEGTDICIYSIGNIHANHFVEHSATVEEIAEGDRFPSFISPGREMKTGKAPLKPKRSRFIYAVKDSSPSLQTAKEHSSEKQTDPDNNILKKDVDEATASTRLDYLNLISAAEKILTAQIPVDSFIYNEKAFLQDKISSLSDISSAQLEVVSTELPREEILHKVEETGKETEDGNITEKEKCSTISYDKSGDTTLINSFANPKKKRKHPKCCTIS